MANKDQTVNLDVRNFTSADPYKAVEFVNGTPNPGNLSYSYAFTGGTDSKGDVEVYHGQGAINITVNCIADRRYKMNELDFDTTLDLSVTPPANTGTGRKFVIHDTAVNVIDAYYKVLVTDTTNGDCQFYCDPRVRNR
jgi:hypothetical protein